MLTADKIARAFLILLSPAMICWTSYCLWRLVTTGKLYFREHGSIIEVGSGFNFAITRGLYVLLFLASLAILSSCLSCLIGVLSRKK